MFFNKDDVNKIQSKLKQMEDASNTAQKKTERIRGAMEYALGCYINALSEISSLGVTNAWFYTGIDAPYDQYKVSFIANTNGQIHIVDHGKYNNYRKEIRSSAKEMQKMVQSGIIRYEYDPHGWNSVYLGNYIFGIGMLSCETKSLDGGYEIIDALTNSRIETNVKNYIMSKVEFVIGGGHDMI